eukprot:1873952-Rhodomonas_salina.1
MEMSITSLFDILIRFFGQFLVQTPTPSVPHMGRREVPASSRQYHSAIPPCQLWYCGFAVGHYTHGGTEAGRTR